jgi:hypothetical protein
VTERPRNEEYAKWQNSITQFPTPMYFCWAGRRAVTSVAGKTRKSNHTTEVLTRTGPKAE